MGSMTQDGNDYRTYGTQLSLNNKNTEHLIEGEQFSHNTNRYISNYLI